LKELEEFGTDNRIFEIEWNRNSKNNHLDLEPEYGHHVGLPVVFLRFFCFIYMEGTAEQKVSVVVYRPEMCRA